MDSDDPWVVVLAIVMDPVSASQLVNTTASHTPLGLGKAALNVLWLLWLYPDKLQHHIPR